MNKRNTWLRMPGLAVTYLYALLILGPLYIVLVTAFKSDEDVNVHPLSLPSSLHFGNFSTAFKQGHLLHYGWNSIVVSATTVIAILVINILCSYGLHKMFNKKLGIFIYGFIMLGMMIPGVGYVSTILLYRDLHLYNTLLGLIASNVAGALPFSTFILVGFLRTMPKEIEEAAIIDGCRDIQVLRYVLVPTILPAIVSVAIFFMIGSWNNLFGPLLLIRNEKLFTIPVGLLNFRGEYSTSYNLMFAAVIMVSIPLLAMYFRFQKSFVESLAGSVKG